jgi:geranylgeranyl diphosphate synthase type 3
LCQIKGKEVRTLLIKAFDQWLKVPAHELNVITEVVGMLHNASLLVDDVEDNSLLRRGIPVAHKIFGVPQTINCANYVYFLSLEKITKLNNICLLKAFTEELLNLHIGQGMDISWRDSSTCPSETEYLKMIENKTGGLLRLAVKLMQCCSTSTEMRDKDLMKLVNCLGRFYQIRDDYLNVQSTDYMKNKSYCEDLTEGKFSFPIIHCINNSPEYGKQLLNILRRRPTDDEVKRFAVSLMEKSGSFVYTLSALEQAKKELVSEFEEIGPNEELNAILKSLFLLK